MKNLLLFHLVFLFLAQNASAYTGRIGIYLNRADYAVNVQNDFERKYSSTSCRDYGYAAQLLAESVFDLPWDYDSNRLMIYCISQNIDETGLDSFLNELSGVASKRQKLPVSVASVITDTCSCN